MLEREKFFFDIDMNSQTALNQGPGGHPVFEMARDTDPHAAFGRAMLMLMQYDSFATLALRQIAPLIAGQVNRGHYYFVMRDGKLAGFLGWALCSEAAGEDWLESRDLSAFGDGSAGDCVVFNTWVTDGPEMNSYVVGKMREVFRDKTKLVARRRYKDGRIRPIRIRNTRLS